MTNLALLASRLLLAQLFVIAGQYTLTTPATDMAMIAAKGWPAPLAIAYLVGLAELLGALCLIVGFQTRAVALAFALFCVAASTLFHLGAGGDDPMMSGFHFIMFMKDTAIAGGFLALSVAGAGGWSIDARRAARSI